MRRGAGSVQTAIPKGDGETPSGLERNHLAIHLHVNGRTVLASNGSRSTDLDISDFGLRETCGLDLARLMTGMPAFAIRE